MQKVLNDSLTYRRCFRHAKNGQRQVQGLYARLWFREKTGIELPQEGKNNISNIIGNSREIEYATASFGQGIAVTPIAMVAALSSLANGGLLMKPHIVKEESVKGLRNHVVSSEEIRRVLKKKRRKR